jgi:hypothetical protein
MPKLTPNTPVTPGLTRGWAFLCGRSSASSLAKGSQTPDQVRGDDEGEVAE